jgi:hypothetical protein
LAPKQVECSRHGRQGIALACVHVATAVDSGEPVGFFWGDDTDLGRPDAWCAACERALVALKGASSEQWFVDADFKILCVGCWDEAKAVLYHDPASA